MIDLTLCVVAANLEDLQAFNTRYISVEPGFTVGMVPIANLDHESLASIGNRYRMCNDSPVFGLCHADMEFGPGSLQAFYDCAMTGAVCGACGRSFSYCDASQGYPGDTSYVWSKDWGHPNERQLRNGYPANPTGPCAVSTLDSSCIFFPTNLGLGFDAATFDGFHCHGEDLCLQAQSRGIPVVVPAANAWHASPDKNGPNWGKERDVYLHKMKAKWPHIPFVTC